MKKKKVFVMMSGGVDSSVAALILSRQNRYEVFGAFIKGYNIDGCQEKDVGDARRAAAHLGVPFYVFDLQKEYEKLVVQYMIDGYKKGITPNPDVMCNKEIKFGLFLKKALTLGADYVATGHYVQLKNGKLFAAKDENKDQGYFLWTLKAEQLKHCLFPIGNLLKSEVRDIAQKAGLLNAAKKDSQGICFLGKISIRDFLKKHLPVKKGAIVTAGGARVGTHEGVWFYTIGQRHLGVKNMKNKISDSAPLYVVKKDVKNNVLVVDSGKTGEDLRVSEIYLADANLINKDFLKGKKIAKILVRTRYRQQLAKAGIEKIKDGKFRLRFEVPAKFVASGQSAVFYSQKGEMLGGGVIV